MQFAELNGVNLHYQMLGAAEDKPHLVFINALGADFRMWRDVIVQLAGDFHMLAYDLRGSGLSETGGDAHTLEDHVWDLSALLEHVGREETYVCGLGFGALVAAGLCAAESDKVRGLVLAGLGLGEQEQWIWVDQAQDSFELDMPSAAEQMGEVWFSESFRAQNSAEVNGYLTMLARQNAEGYFATCGALADADLGQIVGEIDVPTLCIAGEDDPSARPETVQKLASQVEVGRMEKLVSGHLMSVEQPELMSDMIKAFVLAGTRK